jgi:hypothetical protein
MALNDTDVERLFRRMRTTLEDEDRYLNAAMASGASRSPRALYADRYPPGLSAKLYEVGIVYCLYRSLLDAAQPDLEVALEESYPDQKDSNQRMDLAVYQREQTGTLSLVGCIEVKWWGTDTSVRKDLEKMNALPLSVRTFVLLLGTWHDGTYAAVATGIRKLGLEPRPLWCHLFPPRATARPDLHHYNRFYAALVEMQRGSTFSTAIR